MHSCVPSLWTLFPRAFITFNKRLRLLFSSSFLSIFSNSFVTNKMQDKTIDNCFECLEGKNEWVFACNKARWHGDVSPCCRFPSIWGGVRGEVVYRDASYLKINEVKCIIIIIVSIVIIMSLMKKFRITNEGPASSRSSLFGCCFILSALTLLVLAGVFMCKYQSIIARKNLLALSNWLL